MKPHRPLQTTRVSSKPTAQPKATPASFNVSPARREAFAILLEMENASRHSDDLLRTASVSALSAPDRHLTTTLVMGVLRWQIALDAQIRPLLSKPNAKLDAEIRVALRLGAFQLLHLERIPIHAAIGESVALAKLAGHKFAAGMVNAVLRKLAGQLKAAAQPRARAKAPQTPLDLANATAHPSWMVERWIANYGFEQAQAICENGQARPELAIRIDNRIANPETEADLVADGIEVAPGAILTAARRILSGDVTKTDAFLAGKVRIQEEGSQLIAELAGNAVGGEITRILDACAAPGGKTLILGELHPHATLSANELNYERLKAMRQRFATIENRTLLANLEFFNLDAAQLPAASGVKLSGLDSPEFDSPGLDSPGLASPGLDSLGQAVAGYDLILADVPCSGTGTLGRNPEIRHRLTASEIARQHQAQCAILTGALQAASLSRDARIVYSTCSLEPEENSAVIDEVLAASPGWCQYSVADILLKLSRAGRLDDRGAERLLAAIVPDGSLTILPGCLGPGISTDGFFVAILGRKS